MDKMTYPSTQVAIVNIPETEFVNATGGDKKDARFIYNFYVDDESTNDTGIVAQRIRNKHPDFVKYGTINDAGIIDTIAKFTPRAIEFQFTPIDAVFGPGDPDGMVANLLTMNPHIIRDNIKKVYREELFSNGLYTGVIFSDSSLDQKIYTTLSATLAQESANKNAATKEQLTNAIGEFNGFNITEFSLLDNAKFLNAVTNELVDAEFIAKGLNNIKAIASMYITDDKQKEIVKQAFVQAQRAKLGVQFNDKFIWTALNTVVNDRITPYNDDVSAALLEQAKSIQTAAIQQFMPGEIFEDEYDIALNSIIDPIPLKATDSVVGGRIIGYIIDKIEVNEKGDIIVKNPIIIENNSISRAIDINIAYGRTYMYSIRSVALLFLNAIADDTDSNLRIAILASSQNSAFVEVRTFESVPPPPPADFRPIWDHMKRQLRLMWSFPMNKQRDIRRFQIFRRRSIADPFELLNELDFDNSTVRYENFEDVGGKRLRMNSSKTWYVDNEFNTQSNFIYALCSVDAHGLVSNYSTQLQITYNGLESRLNIKQVSVGGAPKQYPNMLIPNILTESVMKDSGHDKVHIYFDPEIIDAVDVDGKNLAIIAKDTGAKYHLNMINLDLQQSEGVDIIIDDLQTTIDK